MSREGSEGCETNSVQQGQSPTNETFSRQQHVRHWAQLFALLVQLWYIAFLSSGSVCILCGPVDEKCPIFFFYLYSLCLA
jgi:hypothetical protein